MRIKMAANVMVYFGLLTIGLWLETDAVCPNGFIPHNGKCYDLLPVQASWAEALHYCEIFGATLAVIENESEQNFIAGMLSRLHDSIPSQHVWLGGTDLLEEGKFIRPDSMVPLTYFKWAPTEPDNLNGQHCIGMFRDQHFLWDDMDCEAQDFPLCEKLDALDGGELNG